MWKLLPSIMSWTAYASLACITITAMIVCGLRWKLRRGAPTANTIKEIAFFHPFCASGGGGERVLWKAVEALGELNDRGLLLKVIIYTIDPPHDDYLRDILLHVKTRFSITPPSSLSIEFVHLNTYSNYLDHSSRFSLVVESWGTMMLAYKALQRKLPHVFIDTTGCAFTYVVARILGGCQVVAYVHYPTISTDMLALVWARRPTYNNDSQVTQSRLTTYAKLVYYVLFAIAYGCVGSLATMVMVNSTWTYGHISSIWRGSSRRIKIVFPPCDVDHLQQLPLEHRQELIVSIGQFRPEKDHSLQIRTLKLLMERDPIFTRWKLVLIGSCRGEADEARRKTLSVLIESLQLQNNVHFVLNQPSSMVKRYLGEASVGLHTMWNEHFGIGVVEMMAAGLLVVGHKSGGPKTDILSPLDGKPTGYLAATAEEYADAICEAIALENIKEMELRRNARKKSQLFSDQVFTEAFQRALLDSGILGLSKGR